MQKTAGSSSHSDPTDARLLHDYVTGQDAGAFAAIVRRHGAMVLGVCRRILRREQDAEDAFQATFLVLMRRAGSLTRPKLLGNWLYGVAYRTAIKMRSVDTRQRAREAPMADLPAPDADSAAIWRDLRPILDDELERLPQRYRAPMVLFYLEGKTAEQVADVLGCPKGTILSRLARARERLRGRLTRRGLALSAGVLASSLAQAASVDGAMVAISLESSASARALLGAAHGTEEGVSLQARFVAQRILREMAWRRLRMTAVLLLAGLLGIGIGIIAYRTISAPALVEQPDARADIDKLQGSWKVMAARSDGQVLSEEQFPIIKLRIQGNILTTEARAGNLEWRIRVDPSSNPKNIDIVPRRYDQVTYLAIYALEGDTLKICRTERTGLDRPAELASKPGSRVLLITAKREPP
jgi:RNA polymerase sigma factor (sigma-70 family)